MFKVAIGKKKFKDGDKLINVLANVNFHLEEGDYLSVLGKSGVGKTSLLHIISGLDTEFDGEISFRDVDFGKKIRVSMIFQEPRLLPWKTVENNLRFALPRNLPRTDKEEKISEVLKLVGLTDVKSSWIKSLSGGMAQRVSIARALIVDPQVLLLDEPFSNLDHFTKRDLMRELKNIVISKGLTCVMVTHDFNEAIYLSNRICILGNRPATIKEEKKVNLINRNDWASVEFNDYRKWLENAFSDEGI